MASSSTEAAKTSSCTTRKSQGDARSGIAPGSTVEFTIGAGRKGDEAHNVKVL